MATRTIDSDEAWGGAPKRAPAGKKKLWIGLGIGAAALGCLTCVGGGIALMVLGLHLVSEQLEEQLRPIPALQAEVGEVQEVETEWARSFQEADDDTLVYRVTGSKGSVLVRLRSEDEDGVERIRWAEMELPSGERLVLVGAKVEAEADAHEE